MAGGSGLTLRRQVLTHRAIEALPPSDAPYRIADDRCQGLAVRVAPNGVKTWDLSYRIRGTSKCRRISLGRVSDVSLEGARTRANALTSAARGGRDLLEEEASDRAVDASRLSVADLISHYVERRVRGRLRTAKEIESRLRRALEPIKMRCADEIRRRDLRPLFDQCASEGMKREAERRRQTVGAMFRWALSQDLVEIDPSAGLTAYDPGTPRTRVFTRDEIKLLWEWLETGDLPTEPADLLRLELCLGARCGELGGMCAEEVDLERGVWTLPAERSKNKRPRVTPLVGMALQIVERRMRGVASGPLFLTNTGRPLTSAHIGHYLLHRRDRMPVTKFGTHDVRRTFATVWADQGVPLELIAVVMGQESGGKETRTLVKHYVRTDYLERKRVALNWWNDHLLGIVGGISDLAAPLPPFAWAGDAKSAAGFGRQM